MQFYALDVFISYPKKSASIMLVTRIQLFVTFYRLFNWRSVFHICIKKIQERRSYNGYSWSVFQLDNKRIKSKRQLQLHISIHVLSCKLRLLSIILYTKKKKKKIKILYIFLISKLKETEEVPLKFYSPNSLGLQLCCWWFLMRIWWHFEQRKKKKQKKEI